MNVKVVEWHPNAPKLPAVGWLEDGEQLNITDQIERNKAFQRRKAKQQARDKRAEIHNIEGIDVDLALSIFEAGVAIGRRMEGHVE